MRRARQFGGTQLLNDAAGIHHHDAIAEMRHQWQIVADQDQAHAAARHQVFDQAQDLCLHCGIQRAGGFVGDEQLGVRGQHHRDHHALAHAAGQFVRIGLRHARGFADLHLRQKIDRGLIGALAAAAAMRAPGFGDLRTGGHHRVQGEFWVLQDQPGALAANGAQLCLIGGQDIGAIEAQFISGDVG